MRINPVPSNERIARVVRSTVRVGSASGFVLARGDRRFLVTAAHVVGAERAVTVRWPSSSARCSVLATDSERDVAVLDVDALPAELDGIPIAPPDLEIDLGDEAWCCGFPDGWDGIRPTLSRGHLAGVDETIWVAIDAGAGSSGGPVVAVGGTAAIGLVRGRGGKVEQWIGKVTTSLRQLAKDSERNAEEQLRADNIDGYARWISGRFTAVTLDTALVAVERHFRTGFVEVVPIDRVQPLLP